MNEDESVMGTFNMTEDVIFYNAQLSLTTETKNDIQLIEKFCMICIFKPLSYVKGLDETLVWNKE